ncbi:hypothetical protein JXB22_09620 [candidate division WOR-3 bacterium]|nr:hypothetical protein [candidate division WOR-3 bacterium]
MISCSVVSALLALTITPQNPMFDKYTIIPPLGHIKAIATTPLLVCAVSDYNLILFDRFDLGIKKTFVFNEEPMLVGYDQFSSDLWVVTTEHVVRVTLSSYSLRDYNGIKGVTRIGINEQYLYLDGIEDRALNKRTGMLESIQGFPGTVIWYEKTTAQDIQRYTFLTPFFYNDDQFSSDAPFARYPITAVYEDGMDLYVGTNGYGILKYNTLSWNKERIIYGPLDLMIQKIRTFSDHLYFISALGISDYTSSTHSWDYRRTTIPPRDMLVSQDDIVIGIENRLSTWDSGVMITMSTLPEQILTLADDDSCVYIGTNMGMFKLYDGMSDPIEFGPDRFSVYSIDVTPDHIYAGGEFALYAFDRTSYTWAKVLPFGIKDIARVNNTLYLLSTNNQLLYYKIADSVQVADTQWILLPYFNVYDIAADQKVVYCASYAGAYYYEPETGLYKVIYNLPRVHYQNIFVVEDRILAVADNALFSLPTRYRD